MIRIHNTLTGHLEDFKPMHDRTVHMFVCGPTVYDLIHIGNARTFVAFDMVAKYLRYRGYDVTYIQNITDIENRIIDRAAQTKEDPLAYARRFEEEFYKDASALGISSITQYVRATDHIDAIIHQVQRLLDTGHAYQIGDGIYFDTSTFPDYGKLSGRTTVQADDAVSRIDENPEKRNPGDFVLWKRALPDGGSREPTWDSPWFKGRPGWHIEDTAITETFFGPQYDLHGGGRDLIFPHHEAEIAQQESAAGKKPFVRFWLHAGFLVTNKEKMGKSLGNFTYARDILANYPKETVRLYFLGAHLRSPLEFSEDGLHQAEAGIMRIAEFLERLRFYEETNPLAHRTDRQIAEEIAHIHDRVLEAMDDDFNAPKAIGLLFDLIRMGNQYLDANMIDMHSAARLLNALDLFDHVMGIIPKKTAALNHEIQELANQREQARKKGDFTRADTLRDEIQKRGWHIDDTPYGPLVKKSKQQ
mgnify:CR=1 FL=1